MLQGLFWPLHAYKIWEYPKTSFQLNGYIKLHTEKVDHLSIEVTREGQPLFLIKNGRSLQDLTIYKTVKDFSPTKVCMI